MFPNGENGNSRDVRIRVACANYLGISPDRTEDSHESSDGNGGHWFHIEVFVKVPACETPESFLERWGSR
jgi:hypothetical protein